ncbi:MAG: iron-sulfur cluster-binding domain-containing protein [Ketobacter sp.]|nr:iron-sulfur cluster-binding domain-containing protein [Ketobacter sp.]
MNRISKNLGQTLPVRLFQRVTRAIPMVRKATTAPRRTSTVLENAYEAVVTDIKRETSRAVTVEFELLEGYRLSYKAGQCVTVSLPVGPTLFQRCYSFSSAPHESRYAITVQRIFHGRVSTYFNNSLSVGDRFYIDDPMGEFVPPVTHPEDQRYVMVAAGAGIVPVFSLIKDLLGKNPMADIQLIYASRNQEQAIFYRQLQRLEKEHPGFSLRFQFTRREGDGHDPYRRLNGEKILSRVADPTSALFYICGPYGLVSKCTEAFHHAGISESRIYIETFGSPPATLISDELKPRSITFLPPTVLGNTIRVRQRQVETVLETARRNGVSIPQKCTVGNCQTCKVKIKSGMVIMDEPNSLSLEDAKNGYVLGCMSYPCESLIIKLPGS